MNIARVGCVAAAMLLLSRCARTERTVIKFSAPRISIHVREESCAVRDQLQLTGCRFGRDAEESARELVVDGVGRAAWRNTSFEVNERSLVINGVAIESKWPASRNVNVGPSGRVFVDTFIPFECPTY